MKFFRVERKTKVVYMTELVVDEHEIKYMLINLRDMYENIDDVNLTTDMFYNAYNHIPFEEEDFQLISKHTGFKYDLSSVLRTYLDEVLQADIDLDMVQDLEIENNITDMEA